MEDLENALFLDQVPAIWSKRAYPSLLGLTSWFADLLLRLRELETWATDFVVIISYLSFCRCSLGERRRIFLKIFVKMNLFHHDSFLHPFGWLVFSILKVF